MTLAVILLALGALLGAAGGETVARVTRTLIGRADAGGKASSALRSAVVRSALIGLDTGLVLVAVVVSLANQRSMAPGAVFGAMAVVASVGLATVLFVGARRVVAAPRPMTLLLPVAALAAAGLALHDRVITRGEGLGLVLLFVIYVSMMAREDDRLAGPPTWTDVTPPSPGGLPPPPGALPGPPDAGAPAAALAPGDEPQTAAGVRERPASIGPWLVAAVGVVLAGVGAFLLLRGGVRDLSRTGLTAGFVGVAIIGALAGLGPSLRAVLLARTPEPEAAVAKVAGSIGAGATLALGLAGMIRPLVVDAAGAVAFLGMAAIYALASAVFLARARGGRVLACALVVLYAALIWAATRV